MDPLFRWWRLLEDLPAGLGSVQVWPAGGDLPSDLSYGQLHPVPTTVACLAGVVRVDRPSGGLDLHPGEALIIGAGEWHGHDPVRAGGKWFALGFLPTCTMITLGDGTEHWDGRLPREPFRQQMARLLREGDAGLRRDLYRELLTQVLNERATTLDLRGLHLHRMIRRLWDGWNRGVTVRTVLSASGLKRAQAYKVFTAGFGLPPKQALETMRLELAKALLEAGRGIAETAQRCGYRDPAGFARAWRRRHGSSPRQARQAQR